MAPMSTLESLPDELLLHILNYATVGSIRNLSLTCHALRRLALQPLYEEFVYHNGGPGTSLCDGILVGSLKQNKVWLCRL